MSRVMFSGPTLAQKTLPLPLIRFGGKLADWVKSVATWFYKSWSVGCQCSDTHYI